MTFEQAFLKIKEKFDNADASTTPDFAIEVHFTDDDCQGTFRAVVRDGKLDVEPFEYNDNDAHLDISKSALLAVLAGRVSLNKAIANGDAYLISGDISKVLDWKNTIKKAPAKKAAKKDETTEAKNKEAAAEKTEAVKEEEVPAKKPAAKRATKKTSAAKKPAARKSAKKN